MDKRKLMINFLLLFCHFSCFPPQNTTKNAISDTLTTKKQVQKDSLQLKNLYGLSLKNHIEKKLNLDKKIKIICFGNSITNGYKVNTKITVENPYPYALQKLLQKKYKNDSILVIKEGKNGRRTDQALLYLPQIIAQKPDILILEFGINDVYSNFSSDFFNQKINEIVEKLKENKIKTLITSPTPILTNYSKKVWELTKKLHQFCQKKQIPFVNLYEKVEKMAKEKKLTMQEILPDNIHFADEYYAYLADIIFEYFYE